MLTMTEIPAVQVLDAIKPDPLRADGPELEYLNLDAAVAKHRPFEYQRINRVWEQTDPLRLEAAGREAANQYLLMTAQRLQEVPGGERAELWSQRFTEASVELFGAPKAEIVAPLLAEQFLELDAHQTNVNIDKASLDFVQSQCANALRSASAEAVPENVEKAEQIREAAGKIGEFIMTRFAEAMAEFEGDDDQELTAPEIADRFERALAILIKNDSAWEGWAIERTDDAKLHVEAIDSLVKVGVNRSPSILKEVRGLFGHEVLLHGLRAVNARRIGDDMAAKGLPGYIDGEEGAGTFFEYAITGQIPSKNIDRYVDVSLALGTLNGKPMTRAELYDFVYARALVREQAAKGRSDVDTERIAAKVQEHVNRIYRGSRGDEHIGVFTKDIAYHKGFCEVADFVVHYLSEGFSAEDIFDFLVSGKFDPNNSEHIKYMVTSLAAASPAKS